MEPPLPPSAFRVNYVSLLLEVAVQQISQKIQAEESKRRVNIKVKSEEKVIWY